MLARIAWSVVAFFLAESSAAVTLTVTADNQTGYVKESAQGTGVGDYTDTTAVDVGDRSTHQRLYGILSFDTSGLPTGAVIESVTLDLRYVYEAGDPFGSLGDLLLDGFRGSLGANELLQSNDFEADVGGEGDGFLTIGDPGSPTVDFDEDFGSVGLELINDAAKTQFRLRFDGEDFETPGAQDRASFAASGSGAPTLEIEYRTGEDVPGFVPPDYEEGAFEVDVTLPACDGSAHIIDTTETNWSNVPWSTKDVFCIKPGDYSSLGTLELHTVSGSATTRKFLRYYDPSDSDPEHPVVRADTSANEAVVEALELDESDYWTFDGITIRDSPKAANFLLDSSHNVINRVFFDDTQGDSLIIQNDSDGNVVQNSVFRDDDGGYESDSVCVLLDGLGPGAADPDRELEDTWIAQNEFINCSDGITLHKQPNETGAWVPGTVIADNDIYLTDVVYSECDGAFGFQDGVSNVKNGACACAENGIDVKIAVQASDLGDNDKRVRIENNRIWGYRHTDDSQDAGEDICSSGSFGDAIVIHTDAEGVIVRGNIIWDSPRAVTGSGLGGHFVVNNLIAEGRDCHEDTDGLNDCFPDRGYGISVFAAGDNVVYGNTVAGMGDRWAVITDGDSGSPNSFECNAMIDAKNWANSDSENISMWNAFHNVRQPNGASEYCPTQAVPLVDCESISTSETSPHASYTFHIKRWTGPDVMTLDNAVRTKDTPNHTDEGHTTADCDHEDSGHPWN